MLRIRRIKPADEDRLLALNNANAAETSRLDAPTLRAMLRAAFAALTAGDTEALLLAFDQDAGYGSVNYLWFRARFARFVYVDRVITASARRGQGVARSLYQSLLAKARQAGHDRIVCEVNRVPPNPASDRLHDRLGFTEIGRSWVSPDKQVRYLSRSWPATEGDAPFS